MTELPGEFFSVTVDTPDIAVMYCLGALSRMAKRGPNGRENAPPDQFLDWRPARRKLLIAFATRESRARFLREAKRLLPPDTWTLVEQNPA